MIGRWPHFLLIISACSALNVVWSDVRALETGAYQDVETVEVTAERPQDISNAPGSVSAVTGAQLAFLAPDTLADILLLAPSVNVRTNSRGEVLASVRGSGERQLAIFWQKIPINVPWDNRFDLSLIPAAGISSAVLQSGPSAVGYGANTAGGIVEVTSSAKPGFGGQAFAGSGDMVGLEALLATKAAGFEGQIATSYRNLDGRVSPADQLFSEGNNGLLRNTDRQTASVSANATWQTGDVKTGASFLHSRAEYGIAPEQGPRVDLSDSRFWRFPDTDHTLVAGHVELPLASSLLADLRVWYQGFGQEIQSFTDGSYSEIESRQLDDNDTIGARFQFVQAKGNHLSTLSATGLWSRHEQLEVTPNTEAGEAEVFTHFLGSVALDHQRPIGQVMNLHVGVGFDVFNPRRTAGRENVGNFNGTNVSINLVSNHVRNWVFRLGAGRRARLPTMRELFGEALGRFIVNPDLKAERSRFYEVSARRNWRSGSIEVTPFFVDTKDTLDQTRILADENLLRQRVNLAGSRSYGIETKLNLQLASGLTLDGNATWNRNRAKSDSVAKSTRRLYLSDRPNWLARLNVRYQLGAWTTLGLSVVHRGAAKSEVADGEFLDLSAATTVDLSARHRLSIAPGGSNIELFAQLDNLTDAFLEPQLGLPDPGRTLKLGLRAAF